MARARNNVTRLSGESRLKICAMLNDGATYDDIRTDADIATDSLERGLVLHNSSLRAYRDGDEYGEYRRSIAKWGRDMQRKNMAALIVEGGKGSENIAKIADYEILNICIEKLQSGDELEAKELTSISRAVANYNHNKLSAEREDAKRDFAEREAVYQAQIADLSAKIVEITGKQHKEVDSKKVADDLDAALGVR